MLYILLLLFISLFAGAYGVMIGAGGGFILVPLLLLVFSISPTTAAGTGLVIVLINSVTGILGYAKQDRINYKLGFILSVGAIPGTFLGLWMNSLANPKLFYSVFAIVIFLLGCFLLFKKQPEFKASNLQEDGSTEVDKTKSYKTLLIIGLFLGIVSGFFGIGGGWLLVPILVYIYKIPPYFAAATSLFSLSIYSAIGVIPHLFLNNIDWSIVVSGGVGVIIGAKIGVYLSSKVNGVVIIKMLSLILIGMGIQLFLTS